MLQKISQKKYIIITNIITKTRKNYSGNTVYNYDISTSKPKFEIYDRVRLSSINDVYRNKLKTNWSKEIFIIENILKPNVNYYNHVIVINRNKFGYHSDIFFFFCKFYIFLYFIV